MSKQRESNAVHREMWRKFVRTINDLEAEIEQKEKQTGQFDVTIAECYKRIAKLQAEVEQGKELLREAREDLPRVRANGAYPSCEWKIDAYLIRYEAESKT